MTLDEGDVRRKWEELAPLLDRMMERVGTEGEFPVSAGSSLAGDDAAANPYRVSTVIRLCLTAGAARRSAGTTRNVYDVAARVLAPAVQDPVIASTPCRRIVLPRSDDVEVAPPTVAEVVKLAEAVPARYRASLCCQPDPGYASARRRGTTSWPRR